MQILGKITAYFFSFIVSRIFGPASWGIFTICFTILNFSAIIGKMGISDAIPRIFSRDKNSSNSSIYNSYKSLSLILGIVNIIFMILVFFTSEIIATSIFKKPFLANYIKICSLGILPLAFIYVNGSILICKKKVAINSFLKNASLFLFALISLIILTNLYEKDIIIITSFIISLYISSILSFIAIYLLIFRHREKDSNERVSLNEIIKISFPLLLASSMTFMLGWVDNFMLGVMSSEYNVGLYNIALKLSILVSFPLDSITIISAPNISKLYASASLTKFRSSIYKISFLTYFVTIPIFIIMFIYAEQFLSFFGNQFIEAKSALRILLVAKLIAILSSQSDAMLSMTKYEKVFRNIVVLATICNIIANYFLIPIYGINGAALASLFSIIVWKGSSLVFLQYKFGFTPLPLIFSHPKKDNLS